MLTLLAFGDAGWGDELLLGALHSMLLAAVAWPAGLLLGLLLALVQSSGEATWRLAARTITSVLRGIPELLTILLIYLVGQRLLNSFTSIFQHETIDVGPFWAGALALSAIFAAYSSEVFHAGLRAMKTSPIEAAVALGLKPLTTLRYIVLPELFRLSAPGLSNLSLSLLKQTSLVSILSYRELTFAGLIAGNGTGSHVLFLAIICAIYMLLCLLTSFLFKVFTGAMVGVRTIRSGRATAP